MCNLLSFTSGQTVMMYSGNEIRLKMYVFNVVKHHIERKEAQPRSVDLKLYFIHLTLLQCQRRRWRTSFIFRHRLECIDRFVGQKLVGAHLDSPRFLAGGVIYLTHTLPRRRAHTQRDAHFHGLPIDVMYNSDNHYPIRICSDIHILSFPSSGFSHRVWPNFTHCMV